MQQNGHFAPFASASGLVTIKSFDLDTLAPELHEQQMMFHCVYKPPLNDRTAAAQQSSTSVNCNALSLSLCLLIRSAIV
jgi:hypothetical protein